MSRYIPRKNETYVVARAGLMHGKPSVGLVGGEPDCDWWAYRFRKVQKKLTGMDTLRSLLVPSKEGVLVD